MCLPDLSADILNQATTPLSRLYYRGESRTDGAKTCAIEEGAVACTTACLHLGWMGQRGVARGDC
jgi:hypothetical protein